MKTKGARFDVPESGGLMRERFAFLDRTWFRLALSLGVLFAAFGFFLYILAAEARVNALEERRQDVRRLVEVARASLRPILSRVRDGELSREEGRRLVVRVVRQMIYRDVHGPNYFFLLDYDGTLWVNPYLPQREGTDQSDLKDSKGFPVVQEILRVARTRGEGLVRYLYPLPFSSEPQDKFSYVAALPEIRCVLGTGAYVLDLDRALRAHLRGVALTGSFILILGLFISLRILSPLLKSYSVLLEAMRGLARDPQKPPTLSLEGFREGSESWLLLSAFLDMDRRLRETGAQLLQDEERLRILVEEAPDGFLELDGDSRVVRTNRRFCELMGASPEDLLSRPVEELFHPDDLITTPLVYEEVLRGGVVTRERRLLRPWGAPLRVEMRSKLLSDGTVMSLFRDLSEREEAQARLQEQQSLLEALFANAPFELWVRDEKGRMLMQNHRAREGQGNLLGETVEEHPRLSEETRRLWRETNRKVLEGEVYQREETEVREGREICLYKVIAPIWREGKVRGILGVALDVTEEKVQAQKIERMAFYDALTDLPNLRLFNAYLEERLAAVREGGEGVALLFLDLDDFKLVNDSLGHALGDQFLVEVAARIRTVLGPDRLAARLGGDEFLVLSAPGEGCRDVDILAGELLGLFEAPFEQAGVRQFLSATLGVACFPEDGLYPEALLAQADMALHKAKREGKRSFRFYDAALQEEVVKSRELENHLRDALEAGELEVFFQPQVGVSSGRVEALEALARWHSPTLGQISPGRFIPVAERSGLIVPLGALVLREACRFAAGLEAQGLPSLRVAVNVSARQLLQEDFAETTLRVLEETGLAPSLLEVEITETTLMESFDRVSETLRHLREKGVRVALDDFGMGYSSLTYLRRLPLDTLKIDRSFIVDSRREGNRVITRAMVRLGHDLGLEVVAEGVETEEHRAFADEAECDVIQGYWYSRPLPPEEVRAFLSRQGDL